MKKFIKGKITILINQHNTIIEIIDDDSGETFVSVTLSPEQLSSALSRLAHTPCEKVVVRGLDRIGKVLETKTLSFEIPEDSLDQWAAPNREELGILSQKILDEENEGWISDRYFGSQNSFFYDDCKQKHARCVARRWIEK